MDNTRVYVNTFAEGALTTEPEPITEDTVQIVMRSWKRSQTIAHYKLYGMETVGTGESRQTFLVGDIGVAKIMLPSIPDYSGLAAGQAPDRLLEHWISGIVDDYDFQDEANPVIVLSRTKALQRMQEINVRRVQPGERAFGVIQGFMRGAYVMNVGGYSAVMPRAFYDWDYGMQGAVGDSFYVQVLPSRDGRMRVSRKALLKNPLDDANLRIKRGMIVRVRVTHSYRGSLKGEVRPGVKISIGMANMHRIPQVGDEVSVRVLGSNSRELYGVMVR